MTKFNKTKIKPKYAEGGTFDPEMMKSLSGLFSNADTSNSKSTGELIGSGLGAASSLLGVPAPIGMAVGKTIGGLIGGSMGKEKPVVPAKANTNPFGNIQFKNGGEPPKYNWGNNTSKYNIKENKDYVSNTTKTSKKNSTYQNDYKNMIKEKSDTSNYDLQRFYKDNPEQARKFMFEQNTHAPDTYKKDNHITFSNESIYSKGNKIGGTWTNENGKDVFTPSDYNKSKYSKEEYEKYFKENEPSSILKYTNGGDLKQYNAPTHEQGGQMIDSNMNPTNNPNLAVGEIEKNENGYKNYIYSDTLGNGKKTFADLAKGIMGKYKDKNDSISNKTKDMELERLKQQNEAVKQQNDIQNQPAKFEGGGDLGSENLSMLDGMQLMDEYNPDANKTNNNLKNLGLAGLGLSFGLKAADALGNNVEQEGLQLNPEANQVKDLMGNRSINFQSILNQIDTSKNAALANNNSARSANVKRALDTNVFSNAMQQMANSKLQEQQANNQYRGEEAGVLNNLGQQESAERIRQQNIQSMNSANLRNMRRDLIGDVNKMGMESLNLDNYDKALKNKQDINRLTIDQYKSLAPSLLKYYDVAENPDGTIKLTLKK